jgi:SAM-dependent methyltransferase
MNNSDQWVPTKAEFRRGRWRASRDSRNVAVGSRAIADWTIAAYENAINHYAHGKLADIGCGNAPYYGIYRDKVTEAIGVDWPASIHSSPHVDVFSDLNNAIDIPDDSIDTILCTDVLEHIYEPRRLWMEFARILRSGGVVLVGVPFLYKIHEAPHDYHRYTCFALRRYGEEAGLVVISIDPIGGLPHVMTDLLCKATRRIPFVADTLRGMVTIALRFGPLCRAANASAKHFPLAYLMVASKP